MWGRARPAAPHTGALLLAAALAGFPSPALATTAWPVPSAVLAQAAPPAKAPSVEAGNLFRAGSTAFAAGDLPTAHTAFARLVHLAPRVAAAHAAFGAVLLAEGDARGATRELTEAHQLDPSDSRTSVNLAQAFAALGDDSRAVVTFRSLPPDAALAPDETIAFAGALTRTHDLAGAQALLERAAAATPGAQLSDALGVVLVARNDLPAAMTQFQQAIATDASFAPAHAHLGSALLRAGDPAHAAAELREAERLGDTTPIVETELGRALSAMHDDPAAVAILRHALATESSSPGSASLDTRYALAVALQAAGNSAESLPLFATVVAARPHDTAALTNYGLALVQTGDAKGALPVYQRALTAGDATATLREDMGVAYLQQNDIDHALEQFRAGLALDSSSPQLHYDLGLAYKLKDDPAAAVPELERAAALDPQLPDPPFTLGILRMQQGKFAEAARQFERAVALQPANGEAWALLGSVYRDSGDRPRAIDALRRAIALEPDQPSPHITLAALLVQQGDTASAAAERKIAGTLTRAAVNQQKAGFALDSGRTLLREGKLPEAIAQLQTAVAAAPDLPAAHLALAEALERQGRTADALTERRTGEKLAEQQVAPPAPTKP